MFIVAAFLEGLQPLQSEYFTDNKIEYIDFRDVDMLKKFISDKGKILPRRVTGTKSYYQKHLALAIKRARHMALLSFVEE